MLLITLPLWNTWTLLSWITKTVPGSINWIAKTTYLAPYGQANPTCTMLSRQP